MTPRLKVVGDKVRAAGPIQDLTRKRGGRAGIAASNSPLNTEEEQALAQFTELLYGMPIPIPN
jgi:hypothetical protein